MTYHDDDGDNSSSTYPPGASSPPARPKRPPSLPRLRRPGSIIIDTPVTVDAVFASIGGLGKQQWKYTLALALIHAVFPFHMLQYSFVGRKLDYECAEKEEAKETVGGVCVIGDAKNASGGKCAHGVRFTLEGETSIQTEWGLVCER